MSCLPNNQETLVLQQVLKQAELVEKNKQAAREQLLRIQLILAKKAK
jgi:hypothetical protein